jgi:hypothetical protein
MNNRIPQTEKPDLQVGMIIAEGYYYNCMFFQELPPELTEFGKGGNVCGILFRKDDEPDHWIVRYRVRHYMDGRTFEHDDKVEWQQFSRICPETEARDCVNEWLKIGKEQFNLKDFEFIEVHGDVTQFLAAGLKANKPWFQMRITGQKPEEN